MKKQPLTLVITTTVKYNYEKTAINISYKQQQQQQQQQHCHCLHTSSLMGPIKTIVLKFLSTIILQKSSLVLSRGCCVTTNSAFLPNTCRDNE